MIPTGRFAIVCAGGGPRAAAALRARFAGVEFRYAGPAAGAPYGVAADPTPEVALAAVQAPAAIVLDPSVLLDPATADALLAAAPPGTLVTPMLLRPDGVVDAAGSVIAADPARGGAVVHQVCAGAVPAAVGTAPVPRALDGRCIAGATHTLRLVAPDANGPAAWLTRTAAASNDVRFAVAAVAVSFDPGATPPAGDDPRVRCELDAPSAAAAPAWSAYASDAAAGLVRRTVRAPFGNDVHVVESIPPAVAVVAGSPPDRAAFERMLRANALPIERIVYAAGAGAIACADAALRNRGDRYVAFVDAHAVLRAGWLDELADALERNRFAAFATFAARGCDARATLAAANRIPLAETLGAFETLHGAVGDLMLRVARRRGRTIVRAAGDGCTLPRGVDDAAFAVRYGCAPSEANDEPCVAAPRFSGIASIVMLSWNAAEYTRIAVESIRAHTRYPHEIVIVDNGSEPATLAVLDELARGSDVRVVRNGRNLGFGQGMNVGMAHARGDVIVILNNDVVVTDGWLEDLVGALEQRRTAGCSAPRSNKVASEQQLGVTYPDLPAMHRLAAERRRTLRGRGYLAQRVVGFCLCLDREVIDALGGFDPLYGLGNYEDDDLCVRMRGAGWEIFVCDDVFIHHFGSVSFKANALDYREHIYANWAAFRAKWGLPPAPYSGEYDIRALARPGFEPAERYIALPAAG